MLNIGSNCLIITSAYQNEQYACTGYLFLTDSISFHMSNYAFFPRILYSCMHNYDICETLHKSHVQQKVTSSYLFINNGTEN